jgi:hypothetical protein
MPRLSYPADWENFAVYFGWARRTSNLSAAGIAKSLEDDGRVQRFELQSLVPLGHASRTQVSKMEACDCGGLWIRTPFGWHQAGDFEIRYHPPPPPHKLRFELIMRVADGDDDSEPVASKAVETLATTEAMRKQGTLEPAIFEWLLKDKTRTAAGKQVLSADSKHYRAACRKKFPGVYHLELKRALLDARELLGSVKKRPYQKGSRAKRKQT